MAINWEVVTVDHVYKACEEYDKNAISPKREAKNTFLLLYEKRYPAKFIRGRAYQIATGIQLNPSNDYSGGEETAKFFNRLGLCIEYQGFLYNSNKKSLKQSRPLVKADSTQCKQQLSTHKDDMLFVLQKRFDFVETEKKFPWLIVPLPESMSDTLLLIFHSLQQYRGFSSFLIPGFRLAYDFYIPSERLLIEYDERQHFTVPRARTLALYPKGLKIDFNPEEWLSECFRIKAVDSSPPYRDEQRAFYDTLRDIYAIENNFRILRLREGRFDRTDLFPKSYFEQILSSIDHNKKNPSPFTLTHLKPSSKKLNHTQNLNEGSNINNIAIVSHNYNIIDDNGFQDYSKYFHQINRICDNEGCDTILYSLHTWDIRSSVPKNYNTIFQNLDNVHYIILEVGRPIDFNNVDHVEIWVKDQKNPIIINQFFVKSSDPLQLKQKFIDALSARRIRNGLIVLCGETNIASLRRGINEFNDPFNFNSKLEAMGIDLILNPIHDYMRRYEMKRKRKYYSKNGRTIISVWNQGKGSGESGIPWTVFHNSIDYTGKVQELSNPFPERPDIRIGVFDLSS